MAASTGAQLCRIDELDKYNFDDYKVIGFGSGIAFGKHYEKFTKAVNGLDVSKKDVFVFSTCGNGMKSQNNSLIKELKQHGANIIGNFSCRGYDTYGPFKLIGGLSKGHPNDSDVESAREFACSLVKKAVC